MVVREFEWKGCSKWSKTGILPHKPLWNNRYLHAIWPICFVCHSNETRDPRLFQLRFTHWWRAFYSCCHSSQCGWSDANCSTNERGRILSLSRCSLWQLWLPVWWRRTFKSYRAILLLAILSGCGKLNLNSSLRRDAATTESQCWHQTKPCLMG